MKTPVRSSRGQLEYTGRLAPESFAQWADSPEGHSALEPLAAQIRFAFFGSMQAARRRVWRQVKTVARADAVSAAAQREINAAIARLETLAFADALPSRTVDLRRLIAVPRFLVNGEAYRHIHDALERLAVFRGLKGGEPLRRWFVLTVVESLGTAVTHAHPSVRQPFPAGDGWIIVGVDDDFEWHVPFKGPEWHGHYFVLELRRTPITRTVRNEVETAIDHMRQVLPQLSSFERTEILRHASASLDQLFGAKSHKSA